LDGNYFSIILQYFTKNGGQVYEAVLGRVKNNKICELRTIYDLQATKNAHELE